MRTKRPKLLKTNLALAGIAVTMLVATSRAQPCGRTGEPLDRWQQSQSLPSFTFGMDVAMRMRHFPWLGFRMQGTGSYEPGKSYVVHFSKLPWFAPRQQHDADLSMLEPALWPTRYIYKKRGEENGNTMFDLRSITDPTLTSATVGLGPKWCARHVEAAYDDGTRINMNVNFSDIDGYMLPVSLAADIDVPHESLSATADFKNYVFASSTSNR
jgi:hypothetical protein